MEKDTMLGALVAKIVELPLNIIKALYNLMGKPEIIKVLFDLVEKLLSKAGKEWFIELKRFLRKEKSWADFFRLHAYDYLTTEELVGAGELDWVNENINSQNFPMLRFPGGIIWVKIVEINIAKTTEKVLAEAQEDELKRPVYGHALLFWNKFTYEHKKGLIVFLHEPSGCEEVMVIGRLNRGRKLSLDTFDRTWPPGTRFAFISEYGV